MDYHYNDRDRDFYAEVYDILIELGGARTDPFEKITFIDNYCRVEHYATEWRFSGELGFGGKFWRNAGEFYVSCYREDRTKKLDKLIDKMNTAIKAVYEKYKAQNLEPFPWKPEMP